MRVGREVTELRANRELWNVEAETDIGGWIAESHELAETVAYDPVILEAVRGTPPGTKLAKINLPESYMQEAGGVARQRIVAAGVRCGAGPPARATGEITAQGVLRSVTNFPGRVESRGGAVT